LSVYRAHFSGDRRSAQISFDFRMHFNPSHLTSQASSLGSRMLKSWAERSR
jgi:hypothetical protein